MVTHPKCNESIEPLRVSWYEYLFFLSGHLSNQRACSDVCKWSKNYILFYISYNHHFTKSCRSCTWREQTSHHWTCQAALYCTTPSAQEAKRWSDTSSTMVTAAILHPLWIRTYRISKQQDVDSIPYRGAHILTCSTCSCSNQWLLSSHYYIVMWVLSTQRSHQTHLQTCCADKSVHRYTYHHLAKSKRRLSFSMYLHLTCW